MQHNAVVLQGFRWSNEVVIHEQCRLRAGPLHLLLLRKVIVFILIAILLVSVTSLAAVIVEVRRDGYRQTERRNLVRIF